MEVEGINRCLVLFALHKRTKRKNNTGATAKGARGMQDRPALPPIFLLPDQEVVLMARQNKDMALALENLETLNKSRDSRKAELTRRAAARENDAGNKAIDSAFRIGCRGGMMLSSNLDPIDKQWQKEICRELSDGVTIIWENRQARDKVLAHKLNSSLLEHARNVAGEAVDLAFR